MGAVLSECTNRPRHTAIPIHMHMNLHIHLRVHLHLHLRVHRHVPSHTHIRRNLLALPHTLHTYIHTCMHTFMQTCMHAYTHTYMQGGRQLAKPPRAGFPCSEGPAKGQTSSPKVGQGKTGQKHHHWQMSPSTPTRLPGETWTALEVCITECEQSCPWPPGCP